MRMFPCNGWRRRRWNSRGLQVSRESCPIRSVSSSSLTPAAKSRSTRTETWIKISSRRPRMPPKTGRRPSPKLAGSPSASASLWPSPFSTRSRAPRIRVRFLKFKVHFPTLRAFVPAPNRDSFARILVGQISQAQPLSCGEVLRNGLELAPTEGDLVELAGRRSVVEQPAVIVDGAASGVGEALPDNGAVPIASAADGDRAVRCVNNCIAARATRQIYRLAPAIVELQVGRQVSGVGKGPPA